MEKLYFVLCMVLLSILTVINVESGWRFIGIEAVTAGIMLLPDAMAGLIKDIKIICEAKGEERK